MASEFTREQLQQWWSELPKPEPPPGLTPTAHAAWLSGYSAGRAVQEQWHELLDSKRADATMKATA